MLSTDESAAPDPRLLALLADFPPTVFDLRLYCSLEWVHRYTLALVVDLLRDLALVDGLRDGATVSDLLRTGAFAPRFHSALRWLLAFAAAEGVLDVDRAAAGGAGLPYRLAAPLPILERQRLRNEGLAIDTGNARTLALLDVAADALPAVARGALSGEAALLGPAGVALWLDYFHADNPLYAVINRIAALTAVRRLPDRSALRILELGAGAGSGTAALLAALREADASGRIAEVCVTEPNALFRRRAERSLRGDGPSVPLTFASLDIDRDWAAQGIADGSVDVVFAVNVLHVALDLPAALARLHRALAPGGLLVAGECIRPYPGQPVYVELVFSLLTSFTDVGTDAALRPDAGFLAPEHWQAQLAATGFDAVAFIPDLPRVRAIYSRFTAAAVCAVRA